MSKRKFEIFTDKYLFFFGSQSIFSQFYRVRFEIEKKVFSSSEQYMMFKKALLFDDLEHAEKILETEDPLLAKKLGRRVRNFEEERWSNHCMEIVYEGNLAKFQQNTALKEGLLETKNRELVEASPIDIFWGIGLPISSSKIFNRRDWRGMNKLGIILMRVRTYLQGH